MKTKSAAQSPDKRIESIKRQIDGASVDEANSYTIGDLVCDTFPEWTRDARNVEDSDFARNVLYHGFQPLFDAIVNHEIPQEQRPEAIEAYNKIVERGIQYLTSYYQTKPQVGIIHQLANETSQTFENLRNIPFVLKSRNIDRNCIYPCDILKFLNKLLGSSLDGMLGVPDAIVGCACGSSEVAMAAAGMLEVPVHFIRRSKRRGDIEPKIISEQEEILERQVKDKDVVCIEDYVCTGNSLRDVMRKVDSYGPNSVHGLSIRHFATDFGYRSGIKLAHRDERFNIYSL